MRWHAEVHLHLAEYSDLSDALASFCRPRADLQIHVLWSTIHEQFHEELGVADTPLGCPSALKTGSLHRLLDQR